MKKISVRKVKLNHNHKRINRIKIKPLKNAPGLAHKHIIKRRVRGMNDVINVRDLFKTKKDYTQMNNFEKEHYISQLTDEFLESADDLMKSLKDK